MYEENLPQYKIELKSRWYLMFYFPTLCSLAILMVYINNHNFIDNLEIFHLVFVFLLIILPSAIGLLRLRVFRVFKIDIAHKILIINFYWSFLRVYKIIAPFEEIQSFKTISIKKNRKRHAGLSRVEYLALAYKSGKFKTLSLFRDRDSVYEYAGQLNGFLGQYSTTSKENVVNAEFNKNIDNKKRDWIILTVFLIFLIVLVILIVVEVRNQYPNIY